jgi:hypothetical protein
LRESIRQLEIKQMEEERLLKEQFMVAYESYEAHKYRSKTQ